MAKNRGRKKSQKRKTSIFAEMNKGMENFGKDFDKNMATTGRKLEKSLNKVL